MLEQQQAFFSSALSAGAILTGFCGTFLSFRIQREANYHRQPVVDFGSGQAKDISIGLSHFSSSFFLLSLASIVNIVFGLIIPLLALSNIFDTYAPVRTVSGGLISGLFLLCGYFIAELRQYRILSNRLLHDKDEWGRQWYLVIVCLLLAIVIWLASYII